MLLFLTLVIAIALTGWFGTYLSRRQAKQLVQACGGTYRYDHQNIEGKLWAVRPKSDLSSKPSESQWLIRFFGEGYSHRLRYVQLDLSADTVRKVRSLLSQHRGLASLEMLQINGPSDQFLMGQDLYPIQGLNDLRFLRISNAKLDRKFFECLSEIEDLEWVTLKNCDYSLADLEPLSKNPHLAWVEIGRPDFGLQDLADIRQKIPNAYITPPIYEPVPVKRD